MLTMAVPLRPGIEVVVVVPADAEPSATLFGRLATATGQQVSAAHLELRSAEGRWLVRTATATGAFTLSGVPAGDWRLLVHRPGHGPAELELAPVRCGESRDLGLLRLPAEGSLRIHLRQRDGQAMVGERLHLRPLDRRLDYSDISPPCDGQAHPWPAGAYRWDALVGDCLWQSGEVRVAANVETVLEVWLEAGVRRYLAFPVPVPAWGNPEQVAFVLRSPDGAEYYRDTFDPRQELPYKFCPALGIGTWQVELAVPDGRRWRGSFAVADLQPSREVIAVEVAPAR
jgi:hypothetical protein